MLSFVGGSSTVKNLVDRVKLFSYKWFLRRKKNLVAPAISMIGRCNMSCVGLGRRVGGYMLFGLLLVLSICEFHSSSAFALLFALISFGAWMYRGTFASSFF
jgi:hypothetical protein